MRYRGSDTAVALWQAHRGRRGRRGLTPPSSARQTRCAPSTTPAPASWTLSWKPGLVTAGLWAPSLPVSQAYNDVIMSWTVPFSVSTGDEEPRWREQDSNLRRLSQCVYSAPRLTASVSRRAMAG